MFARDLKSPPATTTVAVKKQEGTGKVCTVLYMLIGTRLGSSKHVTFVNSHRANVDDVTCDDIMCCKSCIIFCDSSHHFNQISVSLFVCWFYFSEQRKSSKNCSDELTSDKFTSLVSRWQCEFISLLVPNHCFLELEVAFCVLGWLPSRALFANQNIYLCLIVFTCD